MRMSIVLTVAESKRLIAKGVAQLAPVKRALKSGLLAVAKGTTNSYIVEELLGEEIKKTDYCTGVTIPSCPKSKVRTSAKLPDLVLKNGERLSDTSAIESVNDMKAGDVFIKGANALNYEKKTAGILIGHPTGGTIGATIGTIIARRITLVIPVGLEKSIPVDICEAASRLGEASASVSENESALWPVRGEIVTEIEAVHLLSGAQAFPIAAGGIGGAEGSVRLSVEGTKQQLNKLNNTLDGIYGESPFI